MIKYQFIVLIFVLMFYPARSHEIRGEVLSIKDTQQKLGAILARQLSSYSFTDQIFMPLHSDLSKEYWRIRQYHKTNWPQAMVNITYKKMNSTTKRLEKVSYTEYSTVVEALSDIPDDSKPLATYSRTGYEYQYDSFHIFLEAIEGIPPSVEIVSESPLREIKEFMILIGAKSFYHKSVPELVHQQ